jgi:hypothetical protein
LRRESCIAEFVGDEGTEFAQPCAVVLAEAKRVFSAPFFEDVPLFYVLR